MTGIDKRPADGPVHVTDPGPKGTGGSGLAGDSVCDLRHHGGSDQAVYAFAREELDAWERELGQAAGQWHVRREPDDPWGRCERCEDR